MSEILSKDYMGQVTDRDVDMVNLLINNPDMSLDELGAKLGITKQAVAERKGKLEQMGYTKTFYFWNIRPRFEGTSRVFIGIEGSLEIHRVLEILDRCNPIVVFFRTDPESASGIQDHCLLAATMLVKPGERGSVRFIISWSFPNCYNYWKPEKPDCEGCDCPPKTWKNYYATLFEDSTKSAFYSL